jgi:hypothetical protein
MVEGKEVSFRQFGLFKSFVAVSDAARPQASLSHVDFAAVQT